MESIGALYLDYLERTVVGLVLISLLVIVVLGSTSGGKGVLPATLAAVTLGLIAYVEVGRRRVIREHPEFKRKLFKEIRLFWFLLQQKVSRQVGSLPAHTRKQATQQAASRVLALLIVVLATGTIWSSFSISADIALQMNQAIAGARPGINATFFNRALVIVVEQVDNGTVTATVSSEGYPDVRIESQGVDYETIYNGPSTFRIRVLEINNPRVKFFVERL
jgi:hypothetical protein